ncbi:hypothetical protein ACFV4X_37390 [Streptomyces ardesiacus]|uniref:hypothetical protein n=1 Tax=Streptomyces ardesiacus TaxID=285564 RepID=UPI0036524A33
MLETIEALGSPQTPAAVRARQLTQLLDEWPNVHRRVREMRQAAMQEMQAEGLSLRAISAETDVSFGRVREIIQGVTKRPKGKKADGESE